MALSREKVVKTAEKYVSKGRIEAGIKEYRKLLARYPKDISTLNRVGDLYARIDQTDKATELFLQIAEQYKKDGFFVKAIAIYKKILKLDPLRLTTYEALAELYHRQGLPTEARAQYQVLAEHYESDADSRRAAEIYERMAELEPGNPQHHARLAELYRGLGKPQLALKAYSAIADLMLRHGHRAEAAQVYDRALDVEGGDIAFITDSVMRMRSESMIPEAARFLAAAIERNPTEEGLQRLVVAEEPESEPEAEEESASTGPSDAATQQISPEAEELPAPPFEDRLERRPTIEVQPETISLDEGLSLDDGEVSDADEGLTDSQVVPPEDLLDAGPGAAFLAPELEDPVLPELEAALPEFDSDLSIEIDLDLPDVPEIPDLADVPLAGAESTPESPGSDADADAEKSAEFVSEAIAFDEVEGLEEADGIGPIGLAEPGLGGEGIDLEDGDGAELSLELDMEIEADRAASPSLTLPEELPEVLEAAEIVPFDLLDASEPAQTTESSGPAVIELAEPTSGAAAVAPTAVPSPNRAEELYAEADVLLRYEMPEKAIGRLEELLELEPDHVAGLDKKLQLELTLLRYVAAASTAMDLRRATAAVGDLDTWMSAREKLLSLDFEVRAAGIEAPTSVTPEDVPSVEVADEISDTTTTGSTSVGGDAEHSEVPGQDAGAVFGESAPVPTETLDLGAINAQEAEEIFGGSELTAPEIDAADEPTLILELEDLEAPPPDEAIEAQADQSDQQVLEAVEAEPVEAVDSEPAADEVPQGLDDTGGGEETAPGGLRKKGRDIAAALDELASGFLGRRKRSSKKATVEEKTPVVSSPASSPESPMPEPPTDSGEDHGAALGDPLRALGDSLRAEIDPDTVSEAQASSSPESPSETPAVPQGSSTVSGEEPGEQTQAATTEDSGTDWLENIPAQEEESADSFEDDEFFDLGAELEQELSAEDALGGDDILAQPKEQSLDDIIEGFKRGVAENLSAEDFETHFNLGIAYREMGLLDEAVGEFQVSARDGEYLPTSASMLGLCFLEKGMPDLAIKWYRRGLEAPNVTRDNQLGLLYDLGTTYLTVGDSGAAYEAFSQIYGTNASFRDVAARLEALSPNST